MSIWDITLDKMFTKGNTNNEDNKVDLIGDYNF